jgi:hypothetical protein
MAEFLDLLESVRADQASVSTLFGDAGVGVRHGAMRESVEYQRRLAEAAGLLGDVMAGRRPDYLLREAMTTSDFPLLFGDIMDRAVLASYREYTPVWENFAQARTVRDFRTVNVFRLDGAESVLTAVPERTEYPMASLTETRYQLTVGKYGRALQFSWETMINDDLDSFATLPARLGRAARRTEQRVMSALYVDGSGPHASMFTAGNANIVTGNPALSIAGLQTAFGKLAAQTDADGEPILIEAVELVVPPALEMTALSIVNATELIIDPNATAGTAQQQIKTANWIRQRVRVSVDPYIPAIATTANGSTSWFLFASPSNGNPALIGARLRGHDAPEVFIKESNQRRVGGAGLNPLDGDFATDTVDYKVRHAFGGARANPKMAVSSNGSGS